MQKLQKKPIVNAKANFFLILCLIIFSFIFFQSISFSQSNMDSKGKDFWITFIPNYHAYINSSNSLQKYGDSLYIFIVAEEPTSGKIVYYDRNNSEYTQNFTITNPKQIYTFKVSYYNHELWGFNSSGSFSSRNQSEVVSKLAFHITSDKEISIYGHSQANKTSDAFLALPTDALGKNYFVMAYNSDGSSSISSISTQSTPSQFAIIATEDDTDVEFILSTPSRFNNMLTQKIKLNKGEVYLVQADITITNLRSDFTGTEIKSDKPIAVFGGQQRALVPVEYPFTSDSRDILIEQMPPLETWGKNAFIVPFIKSRRSTFEEDIYRILAAFDNTQIYVNDVLVSTLNKGEFYQNKLMQASVIRATEPILVAQYKCTSTGSNTSDPFMMLMPPKEQYLNSYLVQNTQAQEYQSARFDTIYTEQYITVIVPDNATKSLTIDGIFLPDTAFKPIYNSGYSYATWIVSSGKHEVKADNPFGILVYGYGVLNSYGYIGGMNFNKIVRIPELLSVEVCHGYDVWVSNLDFQKCIIEQDNTKENVTVKQVFLPPDTVSFIARLWEFRLDGKFTVWVKDSVGKDIFNRTYIVPGSTYSMPGEEFTTFPSYSAEAKPSIEKIISLPLHNYGGCPQNLTKITHSNAQYFTLLYNMPVTLQPGQVDSVRLRFYSDEAGVFYDTITIGTKCGGRYFAIVKISTSECDKSFFEYIDFSSDEKINYKGAAGQINNKWLRLTSTDYYQSGAIWRKNLIPVGKGFTTNFQFRITEGNNNITNENSEPGADGIAFVIQNHEPYTSGIDGGGIGYSSIPNSLAIEFDTFSNDDSQMENYNDPNGNHVAVQSNGTAKNSSYHTAPTTLGMNDNIMPIKADGTIYFAKIDYNIIPNTLRVYIDTIKESTAQPVIVVDSLDLPNLLNLEQNVRAYVGFTASTGTAWENHDILSWYFCPSPADYVSVEERETVIPENKGLICYPNPFSDKTTFEFYIEESSNVKLQIFDVLGCEVDKIVSEYLHPGSYSIVWDAGKFPRNIYYCRLLKGNKVETVQLKLTR